MNVWLQVLLSAFLDYRPPCLLILCSATAAVVGMPLEHVAQPCQLCADLPSVKTLTADQVCTCRAGCKITHQRNLHWHHCQRHNMHLQGIGLDVAQQI